MSEWREFLACNSSHQFPLPHWGKLLIEMIGELMAVQDQINADVTAITTALQSISESQTTIANDLQAVTAALQGQGVDTSALDAVAQSATAGAQTLADTVSQLDSAVNPAPVETPPAS
jgi:hypothetical protein